MSALFQKFGFYHVDTKYLAYLAAKDHEVYYDPGKCYSNKPFLGVVILINSVNYFLPLTSAKQKHATWSDATNEHELIYEEIITDTALSNSRWVIKPGNDIQHKKHIIAVLDIKKMIPVPPSLFTYVDFNSITDLQYKSLLMKEFSFLLNNQQRILSSVEKLYYDQITSGVVHRFNCNFKLLEKALIDYSV